MILLRVTSSLEITASALDRKSTWMIIAKKDSSDISFFRCLEKHLSTILVNFVAVVIFVDVVAAAAAAVAIDVVVFVDVAAPAAAVVASDVVVVIVEVIKREH